jgi:hypothetical protein
MQVHLAHPSRCFHFGGEGDPSSPRKTAFLRSVRRDDRTVECHPKGVEKRVSEHSVRDGHSRIRLDSYLKIEKEITNIELREEIKSRLRRRN